MWRRRRLLMAERPDLIVLGGDYVTWRDRAYVQPAAEALARLSAPHGVFAILGNHDDEREMPAALDGKGFTVLKDARTRLTIRGEAMDVAGIRFWTDKVGDIAHVLRGATSHDPAGAHQAAHRGAAARRARRASAATRTADRSCCRASAPSRRASSRSSPAQQRQRHDHLRQPRRRHGLRAVPRQLPARGGGADAGAGHPSVKAVRDLIFGPMRAVRAGLAGLVAAVVERFSPSSRFRTDGAVDGAAIAVSAADCTGSRRKR